MATKLKDSEIDHALMVLKNIRHLILKRCAKSVGAEEIIGAPKNIVEWLRKNSFIVIVKVHYGVFSADLDGVTEERILVTGRGKMLLDLYLEDIKQNRQRAKRMLEERFNFDNEE